MAVYPLLAVLWALVLVPPMVRRRVRSRAELAEFDRIRLCFVGSTPTVIHPRPEAAPSPVRRTASQRRRRVLGLIGVGMIATLVVALVMRTRVAWGMHLLVYDVLIAYVALLARSRDRQTSRRQAVAPTSAPAATTPVRRLPRSAPFPAPIPGHAPAPRPALLQAASR